MTNQIDLAQYDEVEKELWIQEVKGNIEPKALFTINDVLNTLVYTRSIKKVDINPYVIGR